MTSGRQWLAAVLAALTSVAAAAAEDWPQFLGPDRNGISRGVPLTTTFPANGPPIVWRREVGPGLSGPVVVQDRVILFHRQDDREVIESLDARTGASQWRDEYPTTYRDDFGFDEGPRAVPVVADGVVYTFGAEGVLHAVTLDGGQPLWSVNTMRDFKVPKGFFGAAGSPLVENGRVVANIGGPKAGIIAFDARKGRPQWTATDDPASYSSAVAATIGNRRLAIFLTRSRLLGLDPATGTIQFERPWRSRSNASVNAATPLVVGDLIFVSSEYGPGAAVLRLDGSTLHELWASNDVLSNHYATSVHAGGILYGYHGRQEFGPALRAVELRTGKVRWSEDKFGAGTVTLAGDQLVVMRENGELVMAPASAAGFKPSARASILPGTVRAYPALAGGYLFVRNDDTLICVDLRRAR